jgi:putative ABC transport system permease protein
MARIHWLDHAWQDLRYAVRQLRNSPGFTAAAVLSLTLGIGANTAIFQLVNAVRLRALPVAHPEELALIDLPPRSMRSGWFSTRSARLTSAQWEQIRARQQAFSSTFVWSASRFNLAPGGEARYAEGLYVSPDFFRGLGVPAIIGRTFLPEDDQPGCAAPAAVVSYAFWQRELGGDPNPLARRISLDGHPYPIIGVTGPDFFGVEVGHRYDVAIPLCADAITADRGTGRATVRRAWWLSAMGRLKPGWTVERASAHLKALAPGIMEASLPETYRPDDAKKYLANKIEATPGGTGVSGLRRAYEQPLWLLLATTGLVLLIACANLANLLLARGSVREREIAVRQAIGASRPRLVAQLLAESLLLALSGALLGAGLAQVLSRGLVAFLSTPGDPVFVGMGIDPRVLGFTAAVAVGTCLLFGLLPAVRSTRVAPSAAMRAGGRGLTDGRARFGLRRVLVSAQVALSLVLLVGSLLFVRSLQKLMALDVGFRPEGIVEVNLDLRRPQYAKERLPLIYKDLLERLAAQPGVVSAAQVSFTPVSGSGWNDMVHPDDKASVREQANFNQISAGYFRTMGTALVDGRDFDARDSLGSQKVAIVNETFVKKVFGGAPAIGRSFRVDGRAGKADPVYLVVGVVRNTKYYELREDFVPISFLPMTQAEDADASATYVLRTAGSVGAVFHGVKSTVGAMHPEIAIHFRALTEQLRDSLLRERLMATLAGAFGFLAAVLATLDSYAFIRKRKYFNKVQAASSN